MKNKYNKDRIIKNDDRNFVVFFNFFNSFKIFKLFIETQK